MPEAPRRIFAGKTQRVIGGKPVEGSYRHWWTETLPPGVTGDAYLLEARQDAELKAALDTHAAITAKLGEVAAQRDKARRAMRLALVWLNTQHPTNSAVKQTLAHTKEELRTAIAECEEDAS